MLTLEQVEAAGGYRVIYADPPWRYDDPGKPKEFMTARPEGGAYRGVHSVYSTMALEEIKALPVSRLAAKDAVLFLWATFPLIREALEVLDAWGFAYRTAAFTWTKTAKNGQPKMGLGKWTRSASEVCLLGRRGKIHREGKDVRQGILTEEDEDTLLSVPGRHSQKPAEARERIERLMGDVPRIELFARERFEGWDAWGNEVPGGNDVEF